MTKWRIACSTLTVTKNGCRRNTSLPAFSSVSASDSTKSILCIAVSANSSLPVKSSPRFPRFPVSRLGREQLSLPAPSARRHRLALHVSASASPHCIASSTIFPTAAREPSSEPFFPPTTASRPSTWAILSFARPPDSTAPPGSAPPRRNLRRRSWRSSARERSF